MASKNRNTNAARRERRVQFLVRLEVARLIAYNAKLKMVEEINREAIEMRVRKDVHGNVHANIKVDAIKCRRLYVLPGLPLMDADYHMRNGEYRVCERDKDGYGLRLY